jgi:hypothetical protein
MKLLPWPPSPSVYVGTCIYKLDIVCFRSVRTEVALSSENEG